jgi:hypothetical protein
VTQVPFYRNPIFWGKLAAELGGAGIALSSYLIGVPGLPRWVQLAAGATLVVLPELGYQAHSATVRQAELAAPPTPRFDTQTGQPLPPAP